MNSGKLRDVETVLTKNTIKDLIAAHLYAVGMVNDDEVVDVGFDTKLLRGNTDDVIPLKLKIKKEQEVALIKHNG